MREGKQNGRWIAAAGWLVVCAAIFWLPLRTVLGLAMNSEDYSHILLIPLISGWLLYVDREHFGPSPAHDFRAATPFLVAGILLKLAVATNVILDSSILLSLNVLGFLFLVWAGYIALFGRTVAEKTWFPLAFLLFAVPLPEFLLNWLIHGLQIGSAAVAEVFFNLSGAPVLREGFIFRLPRMSIEVAKECSGIRSSIALVILAVLVSHFSFRAGWKKALFVTAGLAMMLVKNGVRIATLTLLANYVNPEFLYGPLHHQGGIVFFVLGLGMLVPLYWWLRRSETDGKKLEAAHPLVPTNVEQPGS